MLSFPAHGGLEMHHFHGTAAVPRRIQCAGVSNLHCCVTNSWSTTRRSPFCAMQLKTWPQSLSAAPSGELHDCAYTIHVTGRRGTSTRIPNGSRVTHFLDPIFRSAHYTVTEGGNADVAEAPEATLMPEYPSIRLNYLQRM